MAQPQQSAPALLSQRERAARPDLARQEEAITVLAAKVQARQTRLSALRAEFDRLGREREAMREHAQSLAQRIKVIIQELWTFSVQTRADMEAAVSSWDDSDRRFTWLAAAFSQARQELDAAQRAQEALAQNQTRQDGLQTEMNAQTQALGKPLSALLSGKITLMKALQAVRHETVDPGAQLEAMFAILAGLDFPAPPGCAPLQAMKGTLPWPAKGRLVAGFGDQNTIVAPAPPRGATSGAPVPQGLALIGCIGLAVDEATPVKAVHPGTLVLSDAINGLGQVVIVAHGGGMFSAYTHLSRALQAVGQGVATGETLGAPGIYPPAHGSGFSFELRFREKPFNPTEWLTARQ